jgi:hypothetical protein
MDSYSVAFPPGSVTCAAGDHLLCHSGEAWKVYRVEDLVRLQRLIPALPDPSSLFVEEHLLDSRAAAYEGEVYLIVTELDPVFEDEAKAMEGLRGQKLSERARNLLRPAADFPSSSCRVVPRSRSDQ